MELSNAWRSRIESSQLIFTVVILTMATRGISADGDPPPSQEKARAEQAFAPTSGALSDSLATADKIDCAATDERNEERTVVSLVGLKREQPLTTSVIDCSQERVRGFEPPTYSLGSKAPNQCFSQCFNPFFLAFEHILPFVRAVATFGSFVR